MPEKFMQKKLTNFIEKRLKSERAASIWTSTLQQTIEMARKLEIVLTGKPFRPGALKVCMDLMLSTTFSAIESRQLNILNLIIALLKETFKSSSQEGLDEVNSSLKLAKKYSSISLDHLSTSYPSLSYQCCWTFFE
uniref:Uncharacterized protein n=1 Tax=Quercus lobata TaxID=97700 RepID=A0A7N2MXT9_QUELO